jgi:hypothetical protein
MHRKFFSLSGLGLAFWAAGCCMCDAPYDYCGPTFLGGPCTECVTDARMNSVFNPYPDAYYGDVVPGPPVEQSVLQPAGQPPVPDPNAPTPDVEAPAPMPDAPSALPPTTTQGPSSRAISLPRE